MQQFMNLKQQNSGVKWGHRKNDGTKKSADNSDCCIKTYQSTNF